MVGILFSGVNEILLEKPLFQAIKMYINNVYKWILFSFQWTNRSRYMMKIYLSYIALVPWMEIGHPLSGNFSPGSLGAIDIFVTWQPCAKHCVPGGAWYTLQ